MPDRIKILILEHDDFLREIIGNLLHKRGFYILNGKTIDRGVTDSENHYINKIILGTSCADFNGKSSVHFLQKKYGKDVVIYLINHGGKVLPYHPKEEQMMMKHLSIHNIVNHVTEA